MGKTDRKKQYRTGHKNAACLQITWSAYDFGLHFREGFRSRIFDLCQKFHYLSYFCSCFVGTAYVYFSWIPYQNIWLCSFVGSSVCLFVFFIISRPLKNYNIFDMKTKRTDNMYKMFRTKLNETPTMVFFFKKNESCSFWECMLKCKHVFPNLRIDLNPNGAK